MPKFRKLFVLFFLKISLFIYKLKNPVKIFDEFPSSQILFWRSIMMPIDEGCSEDLFCIKYMYRYIISEFYFDIKNIHLRNFIMWWYLYGKAPENDQVISLYSYFEAVYMYM